MLLAFDFVDQEKRNTKHLDSLTFVLFYFAAQREIAPCVHCQAP